MLTNEHIDAPRPTDRRELLRYMERFGRWARRLTDEDLGMVVAFCANVQAAWNDGQKTTPSDPAAAVAQGTAPLEPPTALPGLGAPIVDVADLTSDPGGPTAPIQENEDAAN